MSDPSLVLVGTYAPDTQPGLHAFWFDEATGALTARGSFAGIAKPSFLVVHPKRRWLYTVSETGQQSDGAPGAVWALRFTSEPWTIEAVNQQPSGGDWPCHLRVDATGRWLFVSNYGTGSVGLLPIQEDGSLGVMTDLVQHAGSGVIPQRQAGPHTHSVTLTPDNRLAVVADLGLDQLVIYRFDVTTGKLVPHAQTRARPGAGPRHALFHSSGQQLYVANELDNTVSVYAYDASRGLLRERQTLDTLPVGAPESTVADIHLSPSSQRLYVSNRGHNSLAVFAVQADGRLARVAIQHCGGDWPRNFALAPGGRFLLVANQHSDQVSVLPLGSGAEEIGVPVGQAVAAQPACVQFVGKND